MTFWGKNMGKFSLTEEQVDYLKGFDGVERKEAYKSFQDKYGVSVPFNTFKSWLVSLGVKASGTGRFDGTQKPWAKGLSKEEFWTRYSDDSRRRMLDAPKAANKTAKIGDVHIKSCKGKKIPWIVVSLDYSKPYSQRREMLRRVVWEKHHGEIPSDCMIIHLNGNTLDCRIENLAMIPKKYRPTVLRYMKSDNAEITEAVIKYCELSETIEQARKGANKWDMKKVIKDSR